jgi:hypothetical protein
MLRKLGRNFIGEFSDLVTIVGSYKHEDIYFCPFCNELRGKPDLEGKFYYNKLKQIGHCFRCEALVFDETLRSIDQIRALLDLKLPEDIYLTQRLNFKWTVPLRSHKRASEYLSDRGIDSEVSDHFNIRAISSPRDGVVFINKILHEDNVEYTDFIQIRTLEGHIKYLNVGDQVKPLCWTEYVESQDVCLVEGFISGLSAYQHLIGNVSPLVMLGKSLLPLQLTQLKELCISKKIKNVYIITDGGFFESGMKIARVLDKELYSQDIHVVRLYYNQDPNSMTREEFRHCFYHRCWKYNNLSESQLRNKIYSRKENS